MFTGCKSYLKASNLSSRVITVTFSQFSFMSSSKSWQISMRNTPSSVFSVTLLISWLSLSTIIDSRILSSLMLTSCILICWIYILNKIRKTWIFSCSVKTVDFFLPLPIFKKQSYQKSKNHFIFILKSLNAPCCWSGKCSIQGGPQILKSEAEMLSEGRKQTDLAKLLPGRSVESVKQKCQYR